MQHIGAIENLRLTQDGAVVTSKQELGPDFWEHIKEARENFTLRKEGMIAVASIPEGLANKWLREGFDLWSAPANEIVKKLRLEGYDDFIISGDTRFDH